MRCAAARIVVTVEISNPDKVLFPDAGLTKADLIRHYESVGERMLPFVANSPLTLERYPSGIDKKGFRQKNASSHFPEYIGRIEVDKNDGGSTEYPTIDTVEGIAYLANQGTITFHPWTSRLPELDRPDFLVSTSIRPRATSKEFESLPESLGRV